MSENLIILPGLKPVLEALKDYPERIACIYCKKNLHSPESGELLTLAQKNSISINFVDSQTLDEICQPEKLSKKGNLHNLSHQGVAALLTDEPSMDLNKFISQITASPLPLALALDQIQDVGNMGTLARTAYALGSAGFILPQHNSAPLNAGAFKASCGALSKLPVCIVANLARALDTAEEAGLNIYGAASFNSAPNAQNAFALYWELPAILVLGNENKGIRPGVAKRCAKSVYIPFARKFDSINIAQAGAILMALCASQNKL